MRRMSSALPSSSSKSPETLEALATFEELFRFACPKFVSPTLKLDFHSPAHPLESKGHGHDALEGPLTGAGFHHMDSMEHQLKVFLIDVKTQLSVPNLRSYLRLYSTLGADKLSRLLDLNGEEKSKARNKKREEEEKRLEEEEANRQGSEGSNRDSPIPLNNEGIEEEAIILRNPEEATEECRRLLMTFKHKTQQRRWESGEVLDGKWGMTSDLDFYLSMDMIHISETKAGRRVAEWFVRNINKVKMGGVMYFFGGEKR